MALKEGRCINCGSLLMLEPKQEKGHCLFCDAVFDNSRAFDAAQNPDNYEFPNEEQPPYTGPNLDPPQYRSKFTTADFNRHNAEKSVSRQQAKPQLELSGDKIPELNVDQKKLINTIAGVLVVVAIFLAIFIPLTSARNKVQAELIDGFVERVDLSLEKGEDVLLRGLSNGEVVLSLNDKVKEETALDYYRFYCEQRAELMELKPDDSKKYNDVTMDIISPNGGYRIFSDGSGLDGIEIKELE